MVHRRRENVIQAWNYVRASKSKDFGVNYAFKGSSHTKGQICVMAFDQNVMLAHPK